MSAKDEGAKFTITVSVSTLPCGHCHKRNALAVIVPDMRICWCIHCHQFWQVTLAIAKVPTIQDVDDTLTE